MAFRAASTAEASPLFHSRACAASPSRSHTRLLVFTPAFSSSHPPSRLHTRLLVFTPASRLDRYDGGSGHDATTAVQYLYSVYWALTTLTTVGYGDITPANNAERWYATQPNQTKPSHPSPLGAPEASTAFHWPSTDLPRPSIRYALVSLLIGALVFGYMLSSIGDLLSNVDKNAVKLDAKLVDVKDFTRWHRMGPELAARVRKYCEYFYSRQSAMDEAAIIAHLAPALRREVRSRMHALGTAPPSPPANHGARRGATRSPRPASYCRRWSAICSRRRRRAFRCSQPSTARTRASSCSSRCTRCSPPTPFHLTSHALPSDLP